MHPSERQTLLCSAITAFLYLLDDAADKPVRCTTHQTLNHQETIKQGYQSGEEERRRDKKNTVFFLHPSYIMLLMSKQSKSWSFVFVATQTPDRCYFAHSLSDVTVTFVCSCFLLLLYSTCICYITNRKMQSLTFCPWSPSGPLAPAGPWGPVMPGFPSFPLGPGGPGTPGGPYMYISTETVMLLS